jgi:ABC-type transport system involved in multi-copper enzyme maturation permease subunit
MIRVFTIARIVWIEMLRRKDVYVLLVLLAALLVALLSANVFGLGGVVDYVKETGLLFAWVFSWGLAVAVSARELPEEEKRGTVYSLLAKPVSRFELLVGKWLGSWGVVSAATLCFYGLLVAVVATRGGSLAPSVLVQAYLLHVMALSVICALTLALSTRMNFDAAATLSLAITVGAFLILPRVPDLLTHAQGLRRSSMLVLYWALPHFEVFDMRQRLVFGNDPVSWSVVFGVILYGVLLTSSLIGVGWLVYRKRSFLRGTTL